jgi:hypothetical protein
MVKVKKVWSAVSPLVALVASIGLVVALEKRGSRSRNT